MSYFTFNFYIFLVLYIFFCFSQGFGNVLFFINLKSNTVQSNLIKKEYSDFLFLCTVICFALSLTLCSLYKSYLYASAAEGLYIVVMFFKYYSLMQKSKRVALSESFEEEKYCFKLPEKFTLLPNVIFIVYSLFFIISQKESDIIIFTPALYIIPITLLIFLSFIFIWGKFTKKTSCHTKNALYFISYVLSFFTVIYLEFILKTLSLLGFIFGCLSVFLLFLFIAYYIIKNTSAD